MIVVTGGAGFIGSNLVRALNDRGRFDLLVVDDLADGRKVRNLADCDIFDLQDKDDFARHVEERRPFDDAIEAIVHLGACSDTMEWDGRFVMKVNYEYSKLLLEYCAESQTPLVYASSASVYGFGPVFKEERRFERPANLYAYSKFLFDQHVRRRLRSIGTQVAGLRYFNVYGPREDHKGEQASVAYKLHQQLLTGDSVALFEGSGGYAAGEQRRDFVWVGDAVDVTLWFLDHPAESGIFNVGCGRSQTFNEVAHAVIAHHGRGAIRYIPFPEALVGRYQNFTEADTHALRKAGYTAPFQTVDQAIPTYLRWLESRE